jgi:hypothetical protein
VHRLCPLTLLLFLAPSLGWAAPGKFETSVTSTAVSGAAVVDPTTTAPKVSNLSTTLQLRTPGLLDDRLSLTTSVTNAKNDYSSTQVILSPDSTETTPLSFDKVETEGEVGAEWKTGPHTATLSYGQMLTSGDPFAYKAASAGYNVGFFGNTTVAGAEYNWVRQDQPFTYFTSQRLGGGRNYLRPETLTTQRLELWLEQVLSERWKAQGRILVGRRLEDRPAHYGLELRNAYAVTDRLFARLDTGFIRERHDRALIDDSGYYSAYWAEAQGTYELVYDLLVTAAVGTTVERENVAWKGLTDQVGTDTYGLKVSYKYGGWQAELAGTASFSNTDYRSTTIAGNLSWDI